MMAAGLMVTTSCKHDSDDYVKKPDSDDYVKKPYTVSDGERLEYAQKTLNTIIDRTHDWVLTANYSVKVNVDANLDGIQEIAVLDGNPFVRGTSILAKTTAHQNETKELTFKAPLADSLCYVACTLPAREGCCRVVPGTSSA